jgi:hypothetical protein
MMGLTIWYVLIMISANILLIMYIYYKEHCKHEEYKKNIFIEIASYRKELYSLLEIMSNFENEKSEKHLAIIIKADENLYKLEGKDRSKSLLRRFILK